VEPFYRLNRNQPLEPIHLRFVQDSDTYKLVEGACYAYAASQDSAALALIEGCLDEILVREQPGGGFVLPPRIPFDPKVNHELYAAGHFIEMAVAHFLATGRERALQAACRWADMLIRERDRGNPYFASVGKRDHPEIEVALVRLYRATSEKRYLELASWVALQSNLVSPVSSIVAGGGNTHAVRVGYLLSGYAELYLETGDERFLAPLIPVWDEITTTRLYVTGGMGLNESIPLQPYNLPQTGAIAETCASIAQMMYALRLQCLSNDAHIFDVVETILYNHFLGALNPEQDAVFYYNPLRQTTNDYQYNAGKSPYRRVKLPDLHGCSCCFPNVWRFLAQLPEYVLATDGEQVRINLYTSAEADIALHDGDLHLIMQTDYPLDETVTISVSRPATLNLRIPAWCDGACYTQAGHQRPAESAAWLQVEVAPETPLTLTLPMQVRKLHADHKIVANLGQVTFQYGPLFYCYEADAAAEFGSVERVSIDPGALPQVVREGRVPWLETELVDTSHPQKPYYADELAVRRSFTGRLTPFYLHSNQSYDSHWTTWLPLT
ncbi:MAG: glycoside hydrolase family 127 protein, partial [Anaerolineae bacterium]